MEQITLNNSEFEFTLVFTRGVNQHCELHYSSIGQLAISADLFNGLSVLNFTYIENYESSFFKDIVDDGTSVITLRLNQVGTVNESFEVTYCVDEVRLIKNDTSTQYWAIKAVSVETQKLESYANYYTKELDFKNLIKNLQIKSKTKVQIDMAQISSACKNKFEFISQANETIGHQIERILDMGSAENACYFLGYNFYLKKYSVIEISKETDPKKIVYIKSIPSSMFHPIGTIQGLNNAEKMEGLSASLSYKEYCNLYMNKFDPKARKWERKKISDIDTIKKSIIPVESDYDFLYREQRQQEKESFMFLDKVDVVDYETMGKRNRFLMLNGERLKASMIGDLKMELGNMINLTHTFQPNYGGAWMISSISHWFEKEKFTTSIIVSRGFRLKSEKIEKGNSNEQ